MAGFIGEDQVRRIKAAVDLVQVMGEYAPLRKAGRMWACCCPFHQERSPSCYVYPDQQTYHCFGCGAHGDVITLVRNRENIEFSEAVELIARRAGITITYQEGKGGGLPRGERPDRGGATQRLRGRSTYHGGPGGGTQRPAGGPLL